MFIMCLLLHRGIQHVLWSKVQNKKDWLKQSQVCEGLKSVFKCLWMYFLCWELFNGSLLPLCCKLKHWPHYFDIPLCCTALLLCFDLSLTLMYFSLHYLLWSSCVGSALLLSSLCTIISIFSEMKCTEYTIYMNTILRLTSHFDFSLQDKYTWNLTKGSTPTNTACLVTNLNSGEKNWINIW